MIHGGGRSVYIAYIILQCLIDNEMAQFLHLSRNARLRLAKCRFLSHLKASYKDSPDSKINLGGIWTFRHPLLRCNNVHVSKMYIQLDVNVCFNAWLEDLSWLNTMSLIWSLGNILATKCNNELFQNFANIILRIDLDPLGMIRISVLP